MGLALAVERAVGLNQPAHGAALRLTWYLAVQLVVMLAWVFFRSDGIRSALMLIHNIGDMKFGALNAIFFVRPCFWFLRR